MIYEISYKTSAGAKSLRIRYHEIDGFVKIHDGIRYLVLFNCGWFDQICDRIKYLTSEKNVINHNFARNRVDSYNSLPTEKIFTFHNVIILSKSVVNKNKNDHYYNIFKKKVCIKIILYRIFLNECLYITNTIF